MGTLSSLTKVFTEGQNKAYAVAGGMGGGLVSVNLLDIAAHSGLHNGVELGLKWLVTLVMALLTGLMTKIGADLWSLKIKPKLKIFDDEQKDKQRRA